MLLRYLIRSRGGRAPARAQEAQVQEHRQGDREGDQVRACQGIQGNLSCDGSPWEIVSFDTKVLHITVKN